MLQIDVCQVEVYTLHQQIGSNEHFLVWVAQYSTVITYALLGALVFYLNVFR